MIYKRNPRIGSVGPDGTRQHAQRAAKPGEGDGHKPNQSGDRRTKKKHRSPAHRPWDSKGIVISLGPHDGSYLEGWVTFPVTPETIPTTHTATWERYRVIDAGEFAAFAGRNLDVVSFSGRLEPPDYYLSEKPSRESVPPGIDFDDAYNDKDRRKLLDRAWLTGGKPPEMPDWVVMQDGARGGPQHYLEPHAFKELLERMEKDGEVMRLVIGDNYGQNMLAFIEEFTWRFEDPDPDTLLYDITFSQWRAHDTLAADRARTKPKRDSYTTKRGDTLNSIAKAMWGVSFKWRSIAHLNVNVIAGLWWYPDEAGDQTKGWRNNGSIGHKLPVAKAGFQISKGQITPGKDMISPDLPFRSGVKLMIAEPKTKQSNSGVEID